MACVIYEEGGGFKSHSGNRSLWLEHLIIKGNT
jgi:hypothetical protein